MLPTAAIALEQLLVRRRMLGKVLLDVDMYDRWGAPSGPEREEMMAAGGRSLRERSETTQLLGELSKSTWEREPGAIRAWAEAHVDLLQRFIDDNEHDRAKDTAVFVARGELAAWREVAAGALPYVDENVYYVHVDPARHAWWFGDGM